MSVLLGGSPLRSIRARGQLAKKLSVVPMVSILSSSSSSSTPAARLVFSFSPAIVPQAPSPSSERLASRVRLGRDRGCSCRLQSSSLRPRGRHGASSSSRNLSPSPGVTCSPTTDDSVASFHDRDPPRHTNDSLVDIVFL